MQEEIAQLEVTGESGAGLVKVTINGAHNCRRVEIDPSLLEDDKEMLEDLVAAVLTMRRAALKRRKREDGLRLFRYATAAALRCHSDANQSAVNSAYGSVALPSGRWP